METNIRNEEGVVTLEVQGRIDTTTSPDFEKVILDNTDDNTNLVIDFANVEYVSSAGLRVLLSTYKRLLKGGSMKIVNVNDVVMEILEVTGFNDILNIEK